VTIICAFGGNKTLDGVRFFRKYIRPMAFFKLLRRFSFLSAEATLNTEFRCVGESAP
jgi:hypothetical protein